MFKNLKKEIELTKIAKKVMRTYSDMIRTDDPDLLNCYKQELMILDNQRRRLEEA